MKLHQKIIICILFFINLSYSQDKTNYRFPDASFSSRYNPVDKIEYCPLDKREPKLVNWTELNPKVPRVDYLGVHFTNKDTGWACGSYGTVIRTTDGGNNWLTSNTPNGEILVRTSSFNSRVVIACGYHGMIIRSSDGGNTFSQVQSPVTGGLWGVDAVNDTVIWACGTGNALIKSTDAGISWQQKTIPGYSSNFWYVVFYNDSIGYLAGDFGNIFKTTNGGGSWNAFQCSNQSSVFYIDIIDSVHLAAAGYNRLNVYSSDAGSTWIQGSTIIGNELNWIKYTSLDTGYIGSLEYGVYRTTNRGQNWYGANPICGENDLASVKGEKSYFSVGNAVKVMKAENNRLDNWEPSVISEHFNGVYFKNNNEGWFIANPYSDESAGGTFKTSDGGKTLKKDSFSAPGTFMYFIDSSTGFRNDYNNNYPPTTSILYKTTNAGASWYSVVTPFNSGNFINCFFINKNIGWLTQGGFLHNKSIRNSNADTTDISCILKTTDGGESWFTVLVSPYNTFWFRNIFFIDSLYGWVSTKNMKTRYTTDGGIIWTEIQTQMEDIFFYDRTLGYAIQSGLHRSTDGGVHWNKYWTHPAGMYSTNFGRMSPSHLFIFGNSLHESLDGAETWTNIPIPAGETYLFSFYASSQGTAYFVGHKGIIYKYTDSSFIPVSLSSFSGHNSGEKIILNWSTASETNNKGFEIEKNTSGIWNVIGFVKGAGTSVGMNHYFFEERYNREAQLKYRLKQLDYNGKYSYSDVITVNPDLQQLHYSLLQNYPNPFNPTTEIKYSLASPSMVSLKIYDILGKEIATLINEEKTAGEYSVTFSGNSIPSGVYFYTLRAGAFTETKKLLLLK